MGFSDKQVRALSRGVPSRRIRSRMSDGKELSYIEGWFALAQANRIFGFDGWDRETVDAKCILGREARGRFTAVYSARVRITVRTAEGTVVRDGHGTGEAHGTSAGEAHDHALKAAETDATKRALATFGRAFGLALYAGTGSAVPQHKENRTASQPPPLRANNADRANGSSHVDSAQSPAAANGAIIGATIAPAPENASAPAVAASRANGPVVRELRQRIDKSALPLREPLRIRDKEHLRYVASQPCLLCSATPSDAHHVRFAQPRAMGRKVGDDFTVPLCRAHHRELHNSGNEAAWWHDMGVDPIEIARELWDETEKRRATAAANDQQRPSTTSA